MDTACIRKTGKKSGPPMIRTLPLFISLVLILLNQYVCAQRSRQLSEDPELFKDELIHFMGRNLTENQFNQLSRFTGLWDSAMFNTAQMISVIKAVNGLLDHNARPVPHLINFIDLQLCFNEYDRTGRHYRVWEKAFKSILQQNHSLQAIDKFILGTHRLISKNIISFSTTVKWKANTADFTLVFEDSLRVDFGSFNLKGCNHIDTLTIYETRGSFYPMAGLWKGTGGKVTWERAGLEPGQVFALLGNYTIDLEKSEYYADSAQFSFSRFFDFPISGRLTDRVMATSVPENAGYPTFTSYRQEFDIKDVYRDVDYRGGLSMQGAKLIGSGGEHDNARLRFYREGELMLLAESRHFVFKPQGTSSVSTRVLFFFENDSVFHPELHLSYIDNTREVSLDQTQKVISRSPWYNQFHQVDMNFARLIWKIDKNEIRLTMPAAGSIGNANFESLNFFDQNQYQRMQGMDATHPLVSLRSFSRQVNTEVFTAEAFSRFLRKPVSHVRHQLLELTLRGFIFYDTETDIIRIRKRLYDYLQASVQRIDYDIINFTSKSAAPLDNAIIDLATRDMKVNGIPRVFISNSQNVNIFPEGNTVTIKRNRNFMFDGTINAGNLSFFGNNFAFNYDHFNINLQKIDSISLRAQTEERDNFGNLMLTKVRNLIRNVTGELQVDRPYNKSGREMHHDYPKFRSLENSYVFYDDPKIQRGIYQSANFYFELYPFFMDSLNTFRNEDLRFRGRLVSAGIFPDIEELLTLQDDFSLGIRHAVPAGGIPAYGDKGKFHEMIHLSNNGLRGRGKLDFLTSELYSDDFLFMPDSMNTLTREFVMARQTTGTEFPEVRSANNIVQWLPEKNIMSVRPTDRNFSMYNNQASLKGFLNISPDGLTGSGVLSLEWAEIFSEGHVFSSESFKADHSSLIIHNPDKVAQSVSAAGLASHVDFRTRRGEFRRLGKEKVSFPANKYTGNPESFTWNMANREMQFVSTTAEPGKTEFGAEYISVERGQDSLRFFSPKVIINYNTGTLTAHEVKSISVADASIFSFGEMLTIRENASMDTLRNARLITGIDQCHEIFDAALKVEGRNSFSGYGSYNYINDQEDFQTIRFDRLTVNRDNETIASGKISGTDNFMLSSRFTYKGETDLLSSRSNLNFKGAVRTTNRCEGLEEQWLAFESIIDPHQVLIPVPAQPVSAERERIYSGIFAAFDSIHVYPAFFSPRRNYADKLIVSADGYLKFDPKSGEYRIASLEKLEDPWLPGSYLSLNPDQCLISGEGELDLGVSLGQFKVRAFGTAVNKVDVNETLLSGLLSMDFFFSDDAIDVMAQLADSLPAEPVARSAYYFTKGLNEIMGVEAAEKYRFSISNNETPALVPDEFKKTIVLSDVKLRWNQVNRSYQSSGKIGIAYINGVPVNKSYTGYLEITRRRSGDYLDFYIELAENNWYYFGYTRGQLQAYSSNHQFNDHIKNVALRHRRMRVSGNETRYLYMLASDNKVAEFFRAYHRETREQEPDISDEPLTERLP
jgi:hypothetical protein